MKLGCLAVGVPRVVRDDGRAIRSGIRRRRHRILGVGEDDVGVSERLGARGYLMGVRPDRVNTRPAESSTEGAQRFPAAAMAASVTGARERPGYRFVKMIRCQSFSATAVMSLITCLIVRYSSKE